MIFSEKELQFIKRRRYLREQLNRVNRRRQAVRRAKLTEAVSYGTFDDFAHAFEQLTDNSDSVKHAEQQLEREYGTPAFENAIEFFARYVPDAYEYDVSDSDIRVSSEWFEDRRGSGDPSTDYQVSGTDTGTVSSINFDLAKPVSEGLFCLVIAYFKGRLKIAGPITADLIKKYSTDDVMEDFKDTVISWFEDDAIEKAEEEADDGDFDNLNIDWDDPDGYNPDDDYDWHDQR